MLKNITGFSDKQTLAVVGIALIAPMALAWVKKAFPKKPTGAL